MLSLTHQKKKGYKRVSLISSMIFLILIAFCSCESSTAIPPDVASPTEEIKPDLTGTWILTTNTSATIESITYNTKEEAELIFGDASSITRSIITTVVGSDNTTTVRHSQNTGTYSINNGNLTLDFTKQRFFMNGIFTDETSGWSDNVSSITSKILVSGEKLHTEVLTPLGSVSGLVGDWTSEVCVKMDTSLSYSKIIAHFQDDDSCVFESYGSSDGTYSNPWMTVYYGYQLGRDGSSYMIMQDTTLIDIYTLEGNYLCNSNKSYTKN